MKQNIKDLALFPAEAVNVAKAMDNVYEALVEQGFTEVAAQALTVSYFKGAAS